MQKEEAFIMSWTGKILEFIGIGGVVFTFFFDQIARGTTFNFGWLQWCGVVGFMALGLFGVAVDRFLQTVKDLLK